MTKQKKLTPAPDVTPVTRVLAEALVALLVENDVCGAPLTGSGYREACAALAAWNASAK